MPDLRTVPPRMPQHIGVAADHGGFELKEYLTGMLRDECCKVLDFGDSQP
jgi:ribose 5-phosphate isomerase RpiB